MKKLAFFPMCLGCVFAVATSQAIDLKQSKLTQVVNDVQIISAADQQQKAAAVNDIFSMPDVLRTGAASRAELVAQDETVTRVGANTIFSFDPANRAIDLKQGSLLFHSPHGKGGGTIHTGSATASVLGTTLIVVTTPNGGLKVIALEGRVEVGFTNGLRQKLDPGQMTFVLPGANQLAPVIIFRLDELTQNSLLVKGFSQTLQSLPLIENQIDKQLKQISSGKFSDTGLLAGDNATGDSVEVLDLNTIPHGQHPKTVSPPIITPTPPPLVPDLAGAEASDATINQSSLTDVTIPTPPDHIYTISPFPIADNPYLNGRTFSGFVAQNIYVNTLVPSLNPLVVDLSPYAGMGTFDMLAVNDFSIEGSVTFKGLAPGDSLALIAGNQFNLTPGITIGAEVKDFMFSSPATLLFDNVSLYNLYQDITLSSAADVSFQDNSLVSAGAKLIVNAGGDISAANSHLIGNSALFTSLNGNILFDAATLDAASHAIFIAPTSISLNNSTINSDFVTLNGTANATISLNNTTINASSALVAVSTGDLDVSGTTQVGPEARSLQVNASSVSALNANPNSGSVTLVSSAGSVNVTGTSITAHYLTLNSGDGILLDCNGQTLTAAGSGATANFTAPNLITVNNTDFTPFATVNMAANTIVLAYDTFSTSGIYNFKTSNGSVAINASNPGGLALDYCLMGTTPITSSGQVNLSSGPGNAPGLYSYK
jgi:hypothetical protein